MGTTDALLGALIGSLGTLLPNALNKMFEMFQKKQDHRQQHDNLTQKDLFDRKIKIAEAAISQYSQLKTIASMQRQFFDALLYAIRYKIPLESDVLLYTMKKTELLAGQINPENYLWFLFISISKMICSVKIRYRM